jgi:hypothetical protein
VSMFSFYTLPSSVLGHETHTELRAAYMFYTGGVCERRSRAAHGSADTAPLLLLLCCACAVPRCACAVLCPAPTPFPRDTMPPPPVLCFPRYTHPPTHPPPTPPTHPHTHTHTHAVPGPSDLTQLMQDALVTAAAAGYDVFNALDLLQNATFLKARLAACAALFACTRACVRVCVYACVCVRVCVCVCDDAGVTWPARWTCCRPAAPCRRAGVPRVALCFGVQRAALWPPERTHQLTRSRRCCCCPRPPSPRASPAPTCTPPFPPPPPPHTHTRARTHARSSSLASATASSITTCTTGAWAARRCRPATSGSSCCDALCWCSGGAVGPCRPARGRWGACKAVNAPPTGVRRLPTECRHTKHRKGGIGLLPAPGRWWRGRGPHSHGCRPHHPSTPARAAVTNRRAMCDAACVWAHDHDVQRPQRRIGNDLNRVDAPEG